MEHEVESGLVVRGKFDFVRVWWCCVVVWGVTVVLALLVLCGLETVRDVAEVFAMF